MANTRLPPRARKLIAIGAFTFVGLAWLAASGLGFFALMRYEARSGTAAHPPGSWPRSAEVRFDRARPTLLLFAHPQCPCTRATVGELDRIAARVGDRLNIQVLFLSDPSLGDAWTRSDLWKQAAGIPGVELRADPNGAIARRFGIETSGQVLLYAPDGHLVFQGGITALRGHAGDNAGSEAIEEFVRDGRAPISATPVFGCGLFCRDDDRAGGSSP